jgi:hypothetical protein
MSNNEILEHNQYLDNDDDVIAFSANSIRKIAIFKNQIKTFLSSEVANKLVEYLEKEGIKYAKIYERSKGSTKSYLRNDKWFREGKECEILQVGANGWTKGKIRLKISLEFIPDEPEINKIESPLDDIRQSMNQ